jgi:CTD small phosphatase-like protein 2
MLDPDNEFITARFYRPSCFLYKGVNYVKDLRIFQRDLSQIAIVDNSVMAFRFQLDNGIPIVNFYDNHNDDELVHLVYYFERLAACEDVRIMNNEAF